MDCELVQEDVENHTNSDRFRVRRLHLLSWLVVAATLFSASVALGSSGSADAAETDGVLFGAFAQPRGGESTIAAVQSLESKLGAKLPIVRDFSRWDSNLDNGFNNWVVDGDRRLMLSIKPKRNNGSEISWSAIANASSGSTIHNEMVELARDVKNLDGDVWIAFHHEPEAKDRQTFGSNTDYKNAWRKIHSIFEQQGADVEWVWTMTSWSFEVSTSDRRAAEKWYPGDDYVDYLGADPYNWNQCRGNTKETWQSLERVVTPFMNFAKQHPSKQLVLPEFGSDEGSRGQKAAWLDEAASFLKRPEVAAKFAAVIYFHDVHEDSSSCTWWLDSSTETLNAARRIAADSFFDTNRDGDAPAAPVTTTTTTTAAPRATTTTIAAATPATPIKPGLNTNTTWRGQCTVETINGSDQVSWTSQGNGFGYNIRRSGKWLTSTKANTSYTNRGVSSGNYVIVARDGGKVAAGVCERGDGVAAGGGLTTIAEIGRCRVDRIDGSDRVTWPVQGSGVSYEVSHNGNQIATTSNTWHWNNNVTSGDYVVKAKTNSTVATLDCLRR